MIRWRAKRMIDRNIHGCKYCNSHGKQSEVIQDSATLYAHYGEGKNAPYIEARLLTGGNKEAAIMMESASKTEVNRGTFKINYCPICGRKFRRLKEAGCEATRGQPTNFETGKIETK
ncbi:hypothetical protein QE152_g38971 [Popillia japonica]|uniref:Uncharacterized protein n=1 Tax=Popillia japonica TaxID=7064 RepID=A0AAW1HVU5_POPJA